GAAVADRLAVDRPGDGPSSGARVEDEGVSALQAHVRTVHDSGRVRASHATKRAENGEHREGEHQPAWRSAFEKTHGDLQGSGSARSCAKSETVGEGGDPTMKPEAQTRYRNTRVARNGSRPFVGQVTHDTSRALTRIETVPVADPSRRVGAASTTLGSRLMPRRIDTPLPPVGGDDHRGHARIRRAEP